MTRTVLTVQHSSLEVYDPPKQRHHDADKLFTLDADVVNFTEAGPGRGSEIRAWLAEAAQDHGYHPPYIPGGQDCGVTTKRSLGPIIVRGLIHVLPGAKAVGDPHPYGPKGLPWITVDGGELGHISDGAGHWLTKGRRKGQAQDDKPGDPVNHFLANTKMGLAVAEWALEKGAGEGVVFYSADTNLDDRATDVFRGNGPLVTCHDDVKRYETTGHGPIDVICRSTRDRRVGKARNVRVLTDREFFLFGDHYTVLADYPVEHLG